MSLKYFSCEETLENIEGAIKNGQPRETGNTGHTRQQNKNNTICVGHHYTQTNTNNVNNEPSYKQLDLNYYCL